jgi:hypothetical protein
MRRILAAVVALLGAALPASAATVPYRTDAELIALSSRVVRGRVLDSVVERAPSGAVRTRTRVAVIEDFTGGADPIVVVLERGGRLPDGTTVWIPGTPRFAPGDDVVLCLERVADGYRTVSLAFSAFRVGTATTDGRRLTRFAGVTVVGGGSGPGANGAAEASRDLAGFRRIASTVTGVASRILMSEARAAAAVAEAEGTRVDDGFTLLDDEDGFGFRWQQADAGTPIAWYRNTLRPSPVQGSDTDTQMRVALAAWTDPPTASIVLTFGGTREVAIDDSTPGDPYCTAGNMGVGLVTFGDPLDDLQDGVLAIGGGCATDATHAVNGQIFRAFTHGLVVFNDDAALEGYRTVPNITRILEHEVGHAIGLGHTDQGPDNIMYPACCPGAMPIPPAIGPDDLAGLTFIYPVPVCTFTLAPSAQIDVSALGGTIDYTVTASATTCAWTATAGEPWLTFVGRASGTGNGDLRVLVPPNLAQPAARTTTVAVGQTAVTLRQVGDGDGNADGLFDMWAAFYGVDTATPDGAPGGDADGDGVSNLAEQTGGTHPRGTVRRYLAEGAGNAFFDTEIAIFNPEITPAHVLFRLQLDRGGEVSWPMLLPGRTRRTMAAPLLETLTIGSFSTLIESDAPVVVDRTMRWDATGYGAHAETAVLAPATTWYLAEGSTSGDFVLFYLLQNPGPTAATATVRFLRPAPQAPIDRSYTIAARSRLTIPVDGVAPEVANADVSAVVTSTVPIVVERAMYLNRPGQAFGAGHESAGVTAPATEWFLAEGSTGTFFDLFLLIANPSPSPAAVRVDYLLPSGSVLTKTYAVAGQSRFTVYVDDEQLPAGSGMRPLANTPGAMRVTSTNAVPIIVERAMWWPQPAWYEAHNAPGTTVTGTRWATAGGFVGGPTSAETYILIANTAATPGSARVWVWLENGVGIAHEFSLPAQSRTNVPTSPLSPLLAGQRFSVLVESLGASPVPIVVERATYDSPGGVTWAAGTAVVATRLTP